MQYLFIAMEQRDVSCGAEPGTSGDTSGAPGDEKDKNMDNSHQENEPKDKEYSEADTLTAYTPSEDSYNDELGMRDDFDSQGKNSIPQGGKEGGKRRKTTNHISYSDLSYLNSLSRQEKRRIEGEIIKGRKLGEYPS